MGYIKNKMLVAWVSKYVKLLNQEWEKDYIMNIWNRHLIMINLILKKNYGQLHYGEIHTFLLTLMTNIVQNIILLLELSFYKEKKTHWKSKSFQWYWWKK